MKIIVVEGDTSDPQCLSALRYKLPMLTKTQVLRNGKVAGYCHSGW